jgi:retinoid hydroxylase
VIHDEPALDDTATERTFADIPAIALTQAYWDDRGPFLARLYEERGPIVLARLGQTTVIFLLGPEANRFVLLTERDALSYAAGWGWAFGQLECPRNLLTMDGVEHAVHRGLLHPVFAARRIDHYLPSIVRIIERRLAGWAARGEVDIYEETRVITLDVVGEVLLGLRPGPEIALCRAVYLHGAHRRRSEFDALLRAKIAERRAHSTDDAVGLLARAVNEHGMPLSDEQILAHADTLLIAGHETSASLGAWALYLLVQHPTYAHRVIVELAQAPEQDGAARSLTRYMPILDRALNEAERLYPPIPNAPRGTCRDLSFAGHPLPAGSLVLYSAAASHLLPSIWQDPTTFDPDRFAPPREEHKRVPYALVGFGGGPRVCIGKTLARVELLLFLAQALRRYHLSVVPDQRIVQRYGVTNRPLHGIRMRVKPR